MYAQLIRTAFPPDTREDAARLVNDRLLPALAAEPGFGGAFNLVNRGSGDAMAIVLWTTAEQAWRPLSDYGHAFRKALAHLTGLTTQTRPATSVWRVQARV
jgi:hypothetical protein